MSRGFVKEDDLEHAGTELPERQLSTQPNYVTANGYAQLQQLADTLEQARLALSGNTDEPAAQLKLLTINRDLRYVAARLESAQVIKPMATKTDLAARQILFGATVLVEDEEGTRHTYEIVGEDEADIHANKVSWSSPLAKALIGHKVGDSVSWVRPAGDVVLEIIAIHY